MIADGRRWALLLFLIALSGACGSRDAVPLVTAPKAVTLGAGRPVAPLRIRANVPVVFCRIDGKGPYPFIVDSGSAVTVLSHRVAREIGVELRAVELNLVGAEATETRVVDFCRVSSLEIGRVHIEDFDACVLDLAEIRSTVPGGVEGLLNLDLFGPNLVTLDYPARSFVIERGSLPPADDSDILGVRLDHGIPSLMITLDDTPISLTVDTGSGEFIALPRSTTDLLRFAHGPVDGSLSTTVTGRHRNRLGRLAGEFAIGRHRITRPIVSITAQNGRIGGAFLTRFRLTFDNASGRMRFDREGTDPIEIRSLRSVGIAFEIGENGWKVFDVIPGTPTAATGLEIGDVVVAIQGLPVSGVDEASWRTLVAGRDRIEVSVLRREGTVAMTLPVFELVE